MDMDSSQAVGPPAQDGDTLPTRVHPDFNEVVRSSQSTLQNMDALLKRADRILAFAESGKGSLGKLIYDPTYMTASRRRLQNSRRSSTKSPRDKAAWAS